MEENDNSSSALIEIEQIIAKSKKQFESLDDCNEQLFSMATTIDEFVMQTLQTVAENNDIAGVNETLANSLLQIKNFVSSRPNEIGLIKLKLQQRLMAYEQCITILHKENVAPSSDKEVMDFQTEPEEVLTTEKKNRIAEKFDKDGKYPSRRQKGVRPEKLRDIRRVEAEIETSKNFKEDI